MVNCVHFTDRWAAVLDNNFPHSFEWMSPDELLRRAKLGNPGGYWIVFGLKGGPPPVPVNWKGNVAPRRPSYSYRGPALGAWGRGGCPGGTYAPATGPVGPNLFPTPMPIRLSPPVVPSPEPLRWEWDGDQHNLMQGRVQVGARNDSGYRPRAGSGWGEPCEPPIEPPGSLPGPLPPGGEARRKCRCGAPCCDCKDCRCGPDRKCCPHCGCGRRGAELGPGPAQNFGVNSAQLPEGETFSINGRAVSGDAIKRLSGEGGELADDSHRWHLTVIGSKEECDRVLADLEHSAALAPWNEGSS
jgi:hypothetical protein